jgi:hypothetical protein
MVFISFCFKFTINSLHYSLAHVSLLPSWDYSLHCFTVQECCVLLVKAQLANSIEFYSVDIILLPRGWANLSCLSFQNCWVGSGGGVQSRSIQSEVHSTGM